MMGTTANRHLEKWRIWSKRALGVNGHLKQMCTAGVYGHWANGKRALEANGQRSKWELVAIWLLEKMNISGKWAPGEMGTRANGHLGKMGIWGKEGSYPNFTKGVPQVPSVHFLNVCIWAP